MDEPALWPHFLFLAVLILINGFLAMAELAVVSANRFKIQSMASDGHKKAIKVQQLMDHPSNFLATIQVGITFAGFFTAGSATKAFESRLAPLFAAIPMLEPYSTSIAFVLITLLTSYFTLVFGELLPKRLAMQKPEAMALGVAGTITMLSKIFRPFVRLLSASTNIFGMLFGLGSEETEEEITLSEIRAKIEEGKEKGVIGQTERDMLDGIFEFDNKLAREVMTPRMDVVMIDIKDDPEETIQMVSNGRFSRLPIYEGEPDNIIGMLVIKDLYREIINKGEATDIRKLMRDILIVPETKHIDDLFKQMQTTNHHLAVLIDEYGGFSGIVTIEDLLEEIVGNIFDEHDITYKDINRVSRDTFIVDGMVTVDQLNDDLDLHLDSDNADTIGGYFIEQLGRVPEKGDALNLEEITMEVERIRGRRIKDLKIVKKDMEVVDDDTMATVEDEREE